jgi:hypothetical protein
MPVYELLIDENVYRLSQEVNRFLRNGWTLYGNPIISFPGKGEVWFGQAVMRYVPTPIQVVQEIYSETADA